MEQPELAISIDDFNSTPLISMSGTMDAWHGLALKPTIEGLLEIARDEIVLDMRQLELTGHDAATALSQLLKSLPTGLRVHTVAGVELSHILRLADLGPCVSVLTSFDELGESLRPDVSPRTLRDVVDSADGELPLAA